MNTKIELDDFTRGYIECALWSSNDESTPSGGEPMDKNYSIADISPECLDRMISDCARFQDENSEILAQVNYPKNDSSDMAHAGYDFWLTRNGHGAGFWDGDIEETIGDALTASSEKFGETWIYIGDDGLIHC